MGTPQDVDKQEAKVLRQVCSILLKQCALSKESSARAARGQEASLGFPADDVQRPRASTLSSLKSKAASLFGPSHTTDTQRSGTSRGNHDKIIKVCANLVSMKRCRSLQLRWTRR